jgi:bla regulator protein blaR1
MIPSQLQPVANHLWQSTLFAAVAGLLTLALRKNRAQTRYWVWLVASVKFLVPFSLLVGVGSQLARHAAPVLIEPSLSYAIEQASQPFTAVLPLAAVRGVAEASFIKRIPALLYALWLIGSAALIFSWWRRWRSLRVALRTATPLDLPLGMKALISSAFVEPGVFGVHRPVLLLPAGTDHLTPSQLKAIVAHELCHVRRRDNLATAIQMGLEALFWFHPLVWWLGARLIEERERACDEEVLLLGNEPEAYAEGILKVCELYLESPLPCASGATGSNLKRRIEAIMTKRTLLKLNFGKKAYLLALGTAALALPVIVGALTVPVIRAQDVAGRQTTDGGKSAFEVASVKPNNRGGRTLVQALPSRLVMTNFALRRLILLAYGVQDYQLSGDPTWVASDHYDIEAKADGTASAQEMEGPMLQGLLKSRFRLALHRETKQLPIYEMIVAKGGAKLTPAKEGSCVPYRTDTPPPSVSPTEPHTNYCGFRFGADGSNRTMDGTGVSMALLATNLSRTYNSNLGRNVMDATGISGVFDVHLKWTLDDLAVGNPIASDGLAGNQVGLLTALQEQLGLRLESAKGSVEVLVIDHIERPSEN